MNNFFSLQPIGVTGVEETTFFSCLVHLFLPFLEGKIMFWSKKVLSDGYLLGTVPGNGTVPYLLSVLMFIGRSILLDLHLFC